MLEANDFDERSARTDADRRRRHGGFVAGVLDHLSTSMDSTFDVDESI